MERRVNPRFSLFSAVGLIIGIICGYNIMYGRIVLPIVLISVFAIVTLTLALFKNKLWICSLFVFIFMVVGCGVFQLNVVDDQAKEVVARPVTLTGRVTDIGRNGTPNNVIYLENCRADDYVIQGRVYVVVFDGSQFQTGDAVALKGTLRSTYVFANDVDTRYVRNNVFYQLTDISLLSQQSGSLTLGESIRKYIFDTSQRYMYTNAGTMYALITGDDNAMDDVIKADYKSAGMIHLVAVSGMHLVYIITIFGFFLKRFKLRPLTEFLILIAPLVFFCYVCNWAPSILRALLMVVCLYCTRFIFGRYDLLISLSWSVLILLLVEPYYLFDIGWQLSVLSVFGMATLHLRLDRFLQRKVKNKFLYGLCSGVSISLSCTLATFGAIAHYFQSVPLLGVFTNIIGVPLMSWAFTLGIVGLLPWIFHFVLHPADGILYFLAEFAKVVASLEFAVAELSAILFVIAVTIVWLFVVGQYVNVGKVAKHLTCGICAVALVLCFALAGVKSPCSNQVFVNYHWDDCDVVVTSQSGEALVVSNGESLYSFDKVTNYLAEYNYNSCVWVFTDFSKVSNDVCAQDIANLGVTKVYLLDHHGNDEMLSDLKACNLQVINVPNNTTFGKDIRFRGVYDGSLAGVTIQVGDICIGKVVGDDAIANNFKNLIPNADVYLLNENLSSYNADGLVTLSLYQDYANKNFGANKYGSFVIYQQNNQIVLSF